MKKLMGLVIGLAMLAPGTSLAQNLTARQILEKVSQTYRGLKSFRFTESIESSMDVRSPMPYADYCGPFGTCPARYEADLAVSTPGRIRLVVSSRKGKLVFVSNGRKTWVYIPDLNEYMATDAAPLVQELWMNPFNQIGNDIYLYRSLPDEAGSKKLQGEEMLSLGGKNVRCYVVDTAWLKLWVDEQHFTVLRSVWPGGATWSWRLTRANLGTIPNSTFEFKGPESARRVDSFGSIPGPGQNGGEQLAGLLTGWEMWNGGEDESYSLQGKTAYDFTFASLRGGNVRLKNLRGKIVVLDFCASWCKPCRRELAGIQKLHDELASKGVAFLGIDGEPRARVESFVKAHGYTFPVLLDPKGIALQVYGVRLVPTRVVIDRYGKVIDKYIGAGGEAQLLRALKKAGLKLPAALARK